MYRRFALFAVTMSVFSMVLMGCPKAEEAATTATDAAAGAAGAAKDGAMGAAGAVKDGAGAAVEAGKDAAGAAVEAGKDAAGAAAGAVKDGAGAVVEAGKDAVAAVTDPAKLLEALKVEAGLADVKIQKNDKGELVMTGKVADQGLKAKAEELIKAAGGTVKNAIVVGH